MKGVPDCKHPRWLSPFCFTAGCGGRDKSTTAARSGASKADHWWSGWDGASNQELASVYRSCDDTCWDLQRWEKSLASRGVCAVTDPVPLPWEILCIAGMPREGNPRSEKHNTALEVEHQPRLPRRTHLCSKRMLAKALFASTVQLIRLMLGSYVLYRYVMKQLGIAKPSYGTSRRTRECCLGTIKGPGAEHSGAEGSHGSFATMFGSNTNLNSGNNLK